MRLIKIILLLFLSVNTCDRLKAQEIENWIDSVKSILFEKVYLHVDRELYSPGDRIWFKSYLVEGTGHRLLPGFKNIYVQLVNDSGKVIDNRLILSEGGIANGDFVIGDTLSDGQYTIRAYTLFLENFGEESFFHRRIWISKAKSSLELASHDTVSKPEIDISFLPEGGNLICNMVNHIAFKAVDTKGKGIRVTGMVVDEEDSVAARFSTAFLGMGKFIFIPLEGKKYRVKVDGYPGFHYHFDEIRSQGLNLHFSDLGNEVMFQVSRSILRDDKESVYLVASHKGIVLFYKKMEMDGFEQAFKVLKSNFPLGISKITLLDNRLREQAERLVFVEAGPVNLIDVKLNREDFTIREKASLSLSLSPEWNDTIASTLSLSIVNTDYLSTAGSTLSINSYLLLDSELKGVIESPAYFFTVDGTMSPAAKLDLLMMVHGWRKYYWDEITNLIPEKLNGWNDAGISVSGYVKALLKKSPVVGGKVILGPQKPNFFTEETLTDTAGRFYFKRLYLRDSSLLMINARNEKGKAQVEVFLDPVLPLPDMVPAALVNRTVQKLEIPMRFYRENYFRQMRLEEFDPEKGSILLDDIEVTALLKEKDDGNYRIYGEADQVLKIKDDDYTYLNILDYLEGRVAGLVISGNTISLRSGGPPQVMLDGFLIDDTAMANDVIMHTPMGDIDKIEIIKGGMAMASFGSKGGNGVIAIYTKRGEGELLADRERYIKGRATQRIKGYRNPVRFYAPKYTPETIHNPAPDYRPTMLWDPNLKLNEGRAVIEFFTSDEQAVYTVIVEGISKKGRICHATTAFTVTKKAP